MTTQPHGYWIEVTKRIYTDTGDPRALDYLGGLVGREHKQPAEWIPSHSLPDWLYDLWFERYFTGDRAGPAYVT